VKTASRSTWASSVARSPSLCERGSHVRLKKPGRRIALVVPLHKELRKGTLAGILRDAELGPDDLRRLLD
jgi:HicA toxin of bacterial toxin-antitoxin,